MNHRQSTDIPMAEQALRTVSLAQAIEQADTAQALVSAVERADALHQAVAQARQRGVPRPGLADVVLARAQAIVERARARDAVVAALQTPPWRKVGYLLCGAALLLGLAIDRIANAHRVDVLAPSLLVVLAWNLVVYALLLWQALRRLGAPVPAATQALRWQAVWRWWLRWSGGRPAQRGVSARIALQFQSLWLPRSQGLLALRTARLLHLCAAAWAMGIALSLLLRGLVVSYRVGWESTFLDAAQVHAIVSVLFGPLTAVFGLAPLTLQDIAAVQDFAGEGVAGSRWVWLYVGLLAMVVVLPRLALAAWAHGRAARLARRCVLDVDAPAFEALRAALPADLVLGVVGVPAAQAAALWDSAEGLGSAHGDRLRLVLPGSDHHPVDAVLLCGASETPEQPAMPAAWQSAPMPRLPWAAWGQSWLREPVLFKHLQQLWPQHHAALQRVADARAADQEARFAQALQALVHYLRAAAALHAASAADGSATPSHALQALQATLQAQLQAWYGAAAAPASEPAHSTAAALPGTRGKDGGEHKVLVVGTSAGAAAGAVAGAKVGAMVDLGTGGLSLGAGTALGALLGGGAAWMLRNVQKKEAATEQHWELVEQALVYCLVQIQGARCLPADAAAATQRWHAEVVAAVAAHAATLRSALQPSPAVQPQQDALVPLLDLMLRGMLAREPEPAA